MNGEAKTPSSSTSSRGVKRDNKHLTPNELLQIKSRRSAFTKEHGKSIYLDIFKENLAIVSSKEISIIQQALLDLELNGDLDIKTTLSRFIYQKRSYVIRVHSQDDKNKLVDIIKKLEKGFAIHTSDQVYEGQEIIQLLFPYYLGHLIDGGRLPRLLTKKLTRESGTDINFNINTPPYLSKG